MYCWGAFHYGAHFFYCPENHGVNAIGVNIINFLEAGMKEAKSGLVARRIFSCVGIGVGILSLIFGIVILCSDLPIGGYVRSNITFGADYYTESYTAMARAANNIALLSETVAVGVKALGYLLIVVGLTSSVCFGTKLFTTFLKTNITKEFANHQVDSDEKV